MNSKGSITLAAIIVFLAIIPGLLGVVVLGTNYYSQLQKVFSTTQFAADSIESHVIEIYPLTNSALFESTSVIRNGVTSIVTGNLGTGSLETLEKSFLLEEPAVVITVYDTIPEEGLSLTYAGKSFHFTHPGALVAVTYRFRGLFLSEFGSPTVTVIRKYEISASKFN